MTRSSKDTAEPALFSHTAREEWGVCILSGENQGKRTYLFESGAERTLAPGFDAMMREIERPSDEQRLASARLSALLAARQGGGSRSAAKRIGPTFSEQLAGLRQKYAAGLADPAWAADVRLERDQAIEKAQALLSINAIEALLSNQRPEEVWNQARSVLMTAKAHELAAAVPSGAAKEPRALVLALRDLLHGAARYEQRLERFASAFRVSFGRPASWEVVTAFPALVHPAQHVFVDPALFRKQLKVLGMAASITARPNGADYSRLLGATRTISNRLVEHGETPRDLLDVYDFLRLTLKPVAKKRPSRAKPAKLDTPSADERSPP